MFSLEMSYCGDRGIPHSEFLKWEPEDRGKALAWMVESNSKCDLCGTAMWEWEENRHAYQAYEEICPGCEMKEYARDPDDDHPGKYVRLTPRRSRPIRHEATLR